MEEAKQKIILIGAVTEIAAMSAAVARLAHAMDIVCVAHLEAKSIEMECPDYDLPPVPIGCYNGPWEHEDVIDAKAMAASLASLFPPMQPAELVERERFVGATKPYQGYMNARHSRRRNW